MAFFGDTLDAAVALDWGLSTKSSLPRHSVNRNGLGTPSSQSGPTTALTLMKTLIDESATATFEAALEGEARAQHIVYSTNDMQEGIQAYLERRDPVFTGN